MRVWHKFCNWLNKCRPRRIVAIPEDAIAILRSDGTPYMHMWLDMTHAESHKEPRVCMMFGGKLAGCKIMWSAHTLPQVKAAVEQFMQVPLPPLKQAPANS